MKNIFVAALIVAASSIPANALADGFASKYNVFGGSQDQITPDPSLIVFSTAWDKLVSERYGTTFDFSADNYQNLRSANPAGANEVIDEALMSSGLQKLYSEPEAVQKFEDIYNFGVKTGSPVAAVPIGTAFDLYMTGNTNRH